MTPTPLPEGRYLSCAFAVDPDAGGQTRALLMRNRILAAEGGVQPSVLTFGPAPSLEERRRILRERGMLGERVDLLNIYEHHRERGWGSRAGTGRGLDDLGRRRTEVEHLADGTPWRIAYEAPDSGATTYDYLRADGTPYLRMARLRPTRPWTWRRPVLPIAPDGSETLTALEGVGQHLLVGELQRFRVITRGR